MEKLQKVRRPVRGSFTKTIGELQAELQKEVKDRIQIKKRMSKLTAVHDALVEYDKAVMNYLSKIGSEEEYQAEYDVIEEYSDKWTDITIEVDIVLSTSRQSNPTPSRLPKIELRVSEEPVAEEVQVNPTVVVLMDKEKPLEKDNNELQETVSEEPVAEEVQVDPTVVVLMDKEKPLGKDKNEDHITEESANEVTAESAVVARNPIISSNLTKEISMLADWKELRTMHKKGNNGVPKQKENAKEPSQAVSRWWEQPRWLCSCKTQESWPSETTRPDETEVRKNQKRHRTVWKPGSVSETVVDSDETGMNVFDSEGCWKAVVDSDVTGLTCRFRCNWTDFSIQM